MPVERLNAALSAHLATLTERGTRKGKESIIVRVQRGSGDRGPRYFLEGEGERPFIKMN